MPNTMQVVDDEWLLEFTGVTTSKQSHLLATTNKFVDKDIRVTAIANAGNYSADSSSSTNSTVTPKISNLHSTATNTYGFTKTLPSGVTATNGTNYLLIDPDATATSWSVTPRANITTAGWLDTGNKTGTAVSYTPTIAAGESYYIPILGGGQAAGVSLAGGGITTKTNSNSISTNPKVTISSSGSFFSTTSINTYGIVTTAPSGGTDGTTYLTIDATGTPTDGSATSTVVVTRGAITYSNDAGVIAAHSGAASNLGAIDSSSITKSLTITPTVTDNFAPRYIPIVSTTIDGGGLTTNTNTNEITTAPKVEVTSSGTFKTSTNYGVTTTKPSGTDGTNYLTIDGGGSVKTTGKAKSTVKVTRAAITYSNAAGVIAANSSTQGKASTNTGDITKEVNITPEITDSFAPLYIPIIRTVSQGTTTISGTTVTRGIASWSAGAIAAGQINAATFSATASSGKNYIDISNTSAAPELVAGGNLYINKGYVDDLMISLEKLLPGSASDNLPAGYIRQGWSAYDNDGTLVTGTMATYDGTYT